MSRKRIYKTEHQRKKALYKAITKSHKKLMTTISVRFHNEKDSAVLEKLSCVENKTDYIRQLILQDID